MSAESRATLYVDVKSESAEASLGKLGGKAEQTGKDAKGMGEGFGGAVEKLTGFNVASLAGIGGITALVGAAGASIQKNMEWADTIDRVSRATGESAANTSLMVTAFGAAGVSVGTLESSFKVLTKNGLQPNMETFKKLATEYQAITDPVERNTFAMKNLGRSASEMTEILSKTPAELDALAAAAARSGKVIDEEMIAKAEELAIKSQQLQDKLDGLMIQVGGPLVDTLSKAADGFDGLTKIIALNTVETQLQYGAITEQEAQLKRLEIATGGVGTAWEEYNAAIAPATDAHERASATTQILTADEALLKVQTDALTSTWQSYGPTVSAAAVSTYELAKASDHTNEVFASAISIIEASNLAQAEKIRIEQALKIATGELTVEQIAYEGKIQSLTQSYIDGKISQQIYMDSLKELATAGEVTSTVMGVTATSIHQTKDAMIAAAEAANALPTGEKTLKYTIDWSVTSLRALQAEVSSLPGGDSGRHGGAAGDGYASGGQIAANMPAIVGDAGRPELFVPNQAGYIYPSVPSGANTSNTGEMMAMFGEIRFAMDNLPRAIRDAIQTAW